MRGLLQDGADALTLWRSPRSTAFGWAFVPTLCLLDSNRLGKVARLVNIGAFKGRDVVGQ
jgi:hypothetical protein